VLYLSCLGKTINKTILKLDIVSTTDKLPTTGERP